ncbi:MAG TPA: hypothetical protein VJH24_01910 [Candidatus Bilamarchaeaceae archaeon]|nr:hypothetical protein [Candidatus Bilamarchaeaceae archaeon]
MDAPITISDVCRYILLKKEREDAFFCSNIGSPDKKENWQQQLRELDKQLLQEDCRFATCRFKLVLPHEQQWEGIQQTLVSSSREEWDDALRSRQGTLYAAIKKYRSFLRYHAQNRKNIAKLNLLFHKTGYDRCVSLIGMLRLGHPPSSVDISFLSNDDQKWALRLFQRLDFPLSLKGAELKKNGFAESLDVAVSTGEHLVWIVREKASGLETVLAELKTVSRRMQYYNAERQIRTFPPEEEKEYEAVQSHYLQLLKQKDELLRDFYAEDKLFL